VVVDPMDDEPSETSPQDNRSSSLESRPPMVVSVAMLKALTKDIKRKYGG
jgi:hypothetical protein